MKIIKLYAFIIFSIFCLNLNWAQSTIPSGANQFLGTTSNSGNGDYDGYGVIFFEIPDSYNSSAPIYIGIFDPGIDAGGTPNYDGNGTPNANDRIQFELYGGSGTYSDPNARTVAGGSSLRTGNLIETITVEDGVNNDATTNNTWVYFASVTKDEGELIGDKRIFKVITYHDRADLGAPAGFKNGYKMVMASSNGFTSNNQVNPNDIAESASFVFTWSPILSYNYPETWNFYPYIPNGMSSATKDRLILSNFDSDEENANTDLTLTLYDYLGSDITPGTLNTLDQGLSQSNQIRNHPYQITLAADERKTLNLEVGVTNTAVFYNLSEFWFWRADGSIPIGDQTLPPSPADMIRAYSSPQDNSALNPDYIAVNSGDGQEIVGAGPTGQQIIIQLMDDNGDALSDVQTVTVTLTDPANPAANSALIEGDEFTYFTSGIAEADSNSKSITTDSTGMASFVIHDSEAETVTITITSGLPQTYSADEVGSVDFVTNPPPVVTGTANISFAQGSSTTLTTYTITDTITSDIQTIGVTTDEIHIRPESGLNVQFETAPAALNVNIAGGTGAATLDNITASLITIDVTANFNMAETFTITGIELDNVNSVSSGSLEFSFDGGATWVTATRSIIVTGPLVYTWDNGGGDGLWNTATNWDNDIVPGSGADVVIPNGSGYAVTIDSGLDPTINELTIGADASLDLVANNFTISNDLDNSGTILLNGAAGQILTYGSLIAIGEIEYYDSLIPANSYNILNLPYVDLTINDSDATNNTTWTPSATLTVTGDLVISTANSILDNSSQDINISGTNSNNAGRIILDGTNLITIPLDVTSGVVEYSGGTIALSSFWDLEITGAITQTANNTITIANNLSITAVLNSDATPRDLTFNLTSGTTAVATISSNIGTTNPFGVFTLNCDSLGTNDLPAISATTINIDTDANIIDLNGNLTATNVYLDTGSAPGAITRTAGNIVASNVYLQTGFVGSAGFVGVSGTPIVLQGDINLYLGNAADNLNNSYISHTGAGNTLTISSLEIDAATATDVEITSIGNITQNCGAISIGICNLSLTGLGVAFNAGNTVSTTSGDITVTTTGNSSNLTVSENLQSTTAGTISLVTSGATSNILVNSAVTATGGFVNINATGTITQTSEISSTDLLAQGLSVNLGNTSNAVTNIAGSTTDGFTYVDSNAVTVTTVNAVTGITTTSATGNVSVTTQAGTIAIAQVIDSSSGGGNITLNAQGGTSDITFTADNQLNSGAGNLDLTAGQNIEFEFNQTTAGGNIVLNSNGLFVDGSTVTINSNNGDITVDSIQAVAGGGNESLILDAGTGTLTLNGSINTPQLYDLSLTADSISISNPITVTNDLTINATASSLAIGGVLTAGNNITLSATGAITQTQELIGANLIVKTLNNGGVNITLTDPANAFTTIDLQTRNALDSADVAGTINYLDTDGYSITDIGTTSETTLQVAGGNTVTQSSAIISGGLLLTGAGNFTLTDTTNRITTLASSITTGNIQYSEDNGFNIGTVNAINGLNTTVAGFTVLNSVSANITDSQAISVSELRLAGNSSVLDYTTTNHNIGTLASSSTTLTLDTGNNALNIGTVNGYNGITGTTVTIDSGSLTDSNGATINITTADIDTGTADITLGDNVGDSTDISTLTLAADNATLTLDSGVSLVGGSLTTNLNLTTAGNITQATTALTVGGIATLQSGSGNTITLTLANDFNRLSVSTSGNTEITESSTIILDNITMDPATADFTLNLTAGTATQTAATAITADLLTLTGAGTFTLTQTGNDIDNLTGSITGSLDYYDSDGFIVTAADLIATTGNIVLESAANDITLAGDITTSGGGITLNSSADIPDATSITLSTGAGGGNIVVGNVDGFDLTGDNEDLTLNAGTGQVTMTGVIGPVNPLRDFSLVSNTVSINNSFNITRDLSITGNGSITQTADWDIGRDYTLTGAATLVHNTNDFNLTVGRHLAVSGGTGNLVALAGGAVDAITIGGNFSPTNFTAANSLVTFDGANAASVPGYSFNALTINKTAIGDSVTSTGVWDINGTLTFTRGTWVAGANNHTIASTWDSSSANFAFTSTNSTISFDGVLNITTKVSDTFNHITIAAGGNVTFLTSVTINGDWNSSNATGSFDVLTNSIDVIFNSGVTHILTMKAADAFYDITINNNNTLQANSEVDIDNELDIVGANSIFDAQNNTFNIFNVFNNGTFRLQGAQANATSSITTWDIDSGITEYYGSTENLDPVIFGNQYWNLYITSGNYTLLGNITVLATGTGSYDDEGVFFNGGIFNADTFSITLHEAFDRRGGGTFNADTGNVIFTGAGNGYIGGNVDFYDLTCNYDTDITVSAKTIYIEAGNYVGINVGGNLTARGDSTTAATGPASYVSATGTWLVLRSTTDGVQWDLRRNSVSTYDIEYIVVLDSDSTFENTLIINTNVFLFNCPGWYINIAVVSSHTLDTDNNGMIDRIELYFAIALTDQGAASVPPFTITVAGYTVSSVQLGTVSPIDTANVGNHDQKVHVMLQENGVLDSGATPQWTITSNGRFVDTGTLSMNIQTAGPVTPQDNAAPILAYTLAVADTTQGYVRFSEPVANITGFTSTAGGGVSTWPSVSGLNEEFIITFNANVTAAQIVSGATITATTGSTIEDLAATPNALFSGNPHRVSDIGLGIFNASIIQPLWARGTASISNTAGEGMITTFDGSENLEVSDITHQANVQQAPGGALELRFSQNVGSSYRSTTDFWVPGDGTPTFYGLSPVDYPDASTIQIPMVLVNGNLYSATIPEANLENSKTLEFFYYYATEDLYCGYLPDETSATWYYQVEPWSFTVNEIVNQGGGVSILNNVINPQNGDVTTIHYELGRDGMVSVQVFDLAGGMVEILHRGRQNSGEYNLVWDGTNRAGDTVARGVYFIRVVGPDVDEVREVMVIK